MKITNQHDLSLILAVWLLHDDYDHVAEENYYSATTLMKPTRQVILASRIDPSNQSMDVSDLMSSSLGSAVHDSIEKAWTVGKKRALRALGYPDNVIDRIIINPTTEQLQEVEDIIPVYFEQRGFRRITVNGVSYLIGGKFDIVAEGIVQDNKSTSVFTFTKARKDEDYRTQLSIYRWLNPDKVTEDYGLINFIFTDWQAFMARQNPDYPKTRVMSQRIELMSETETEAWITERLMALNVNAKLPEGQLPQCTDKELWRSEPVHKYYSDPNNIGGRASKNFDDLVEAQNHLREKGKGIVITKPGQVKACGYCPAFELCRQKDQYEL